MAIDTVSITPTNPDDNKENNHLEPQEGISKDDVFFQLWKREVNENTDHYKRYHNYFITFRDYSNSKGKPTMLFDNLLYTDANHKIKNPEQLLEYYQDYKVYQLQKRLIFIIAIIVIMGFIWFEYYGRN